MIVTVRHFGCAEYLAYYGYTNGGDVVFHDVTPKPTPKPLVAEIQRRVANYYRLPFIEMRSARRARNIARPRQVAMYLAKKLTTKSLPEIGRMFGNRDHTTVIHACRQIERLSATNPELAKDVQTLAEGFTQ